MLSLMLSDIYESFMLIVVILNFVMLSVVMLSVVVPMVLPSRISELVKIPQENL